MYKPIGGAGGGAGGGVVVALPLTGVPVFLMVAIALTVVLVGVVMVRVARSPRSLPGEPLATSTARGTAGS